VKLASRPQEYESQYDANHDFAIFANNDQALGGFLGLKEKQNIVEKDEVASSVNQSRTHSQYVDSEADKSMMSMRYEDQVVATDVALDQEQNTGGTGRQKPVIRDKDI
jgi:hypothetical protein